MIRLFLVFLLTISSNLLSPEFIEQDNDNEFIKLHPEVIIQDSNKLFIQRITDAAITPSGHILFISSSESRIFVFDEEGEYLQSFGREGRGPAEFNRPTRIGVAPDGTIVVYDPANSRMSVWDRDYRHVKEFDFMRGWNTYFKTNKTGMFVWSQPYRPMPDGNFALILYEIKNAPWRTDIYRAFKYEDYRDQHEILSTWSKIAIADNGKMIATEGTDEGSYHLYLFDEKGDVIHTFGREVEQPMHTLGSSRELHQRRAFAQAIETGGSISQMPGQSSELLAKPHFINIEIDSKNYLWVHRNKEFGQQEEIDIYTLDGEYKMTVTLPATDSTYTLAGIYGDRALFLVTDVNETPSLHVYRIEYSESVHLLPTQ